MPQGSAVSMLPQAVQVRMFAAASARAWASGSMSWARRLMR